MLIRDAHHPFAVLIRQARQSKKLTQAALAQALQVKQSTISAWETGRYFPDKSQFPAIAKLISLSENQLLVAHHRLAPPSTSPIFELTVEDLRYLLIVAEGLHNKRLTWEVFILLMTQRTDDQKTG